MEAQHHAKTANAGITKCVLPCSWVGNFFEHGDRKSDIFEDDAERTYRPYAGLGRSVHCQHHPRPRQRHGRLHPAGQIYQALALAAVFDKRHTVLGLWMIDQDCCGMGVRESFSPITGNLSSFGPRFFS
jgi:hypothetical protein